ncbi:sulfurtransferase [Thalassobacillus hwangdonensis]|uniref:Sulfurtransferase n=1 Tax=Thalassobacillus hwangdonensis TaxID=546108 RepID=A0ABW3KY09_9BACI
MSHILTVKEAKKLMDREDVIFVDCRFDLKDNQKGKEAYINAHIPWAVYFDLERHMSGKVRKQGGRHPLPDPQSFSKLLGEAGITSETIVIGYDENRSTMSARLLWLMKFFAHKNVYLLDGGMDAWKAEGLPLENGETVAHGVEEYPYQLQQAMVCGMEEVQKEKDKHAVALLDSREFERFAGWVEPIDAKAGHIPGAVQITWHDVYTSEGKWKPANELRELYKEISESEKVIVYCGSGVTAASNVIGLWEAGYRDVQLYVGSFSDWISRTENPVGTLSKD